jgi:hypothetical protein
VTVQVRYNTALARYEARVGADLAGFAQYRTEGRRMTIYHTEVDPAFEGQGVGSQLAKAALDDVRARGLELVPRCPFIAAYIRRHSEDYLDLVAEPLREELMAAG